MELLQSFERASGQKVNTDKSSIFFSTNVIHYNREQVCQAFQMREADGHCKYLGLPNTMGRNKSSILGFLKEKVRNRISSWDGKTILKLGYEILIKFAAQSLPSFTMSVFLLTLEIIKDIERTLAQYWWNSP